MAIDSLNRGNAITKTLKLCIKEGRQTGIHVSPTTLINGIVTDTSSGWDQAKWVRACMWVDMCVYRCVCVCVCVCRSATTRVHLPYASCLCAHVVSS